MTPLVPLARALSMRSVRFMLIGVAGANQYSVGGADSFVTQDHDLFLPLDPENLVSAWSACEGVGFELWLTDRTPSRVR